jgi:hypothetical protein
MTQKQESWLRQYLAVMGFKENTKSKAIYDEIMAGQIPVISYMYGIDRDMLGKYLINYLNIKEM